MVVFPPTSPHVPKRSAKGRALISGPSMSAISIIEPTVARTEGAGERLGPAISVSHDPAINYAFQQNAIPVIRELAVRNDRVARKDLVIRVRTEPAFATAIELNLQSLEA